MTPSFAGLRATVPTTNHAGTEESTCCILPEIKSFLLLSDVTNVTGIQETNPPEIDIAGLCGDSY